MKISTKRIVIALLGVPILIIVLFLYLYPSASEPMVFPDGKKFAFSICDDTDQSTVKNIKCVYDFLYEIGLHTTKTVWPLPNSEINNWVGRGMTLSDSTYMAFIRDLQKKGFEIALHGTRGVSTKRSDIMKGIAMFKDSIGYYPKIHINHSMNRDNLYWGIDRLQFWISRALYQLSQDDYDYFGHIPQSEYFWGDIANQYISYVVDFSFHEINMTRINHNMPYHDPGKPYVNYWFQTSDGSNMESFIELLSEENLDKLEREGGVCIVYTHFSTGFCSDQGLDERARERLRDVASRNGWFATTSEILDYLRQSGYGGENVSLVQKIYIELRWIYEKILYGSS